MQRFNHPLRQNVVLCLSMLVPAVALADGGTVRAMAENDGLAISVFTSPALLTAGEVDISVLVQDAESRKTLGDAQIEVAIMPREHPYLAERHEATAARATNRLLKSSHVQLAPGWHDIEVLAIEGDRRGLVAFSMLVGPAPTKGVRFWPWFVWPAVPIALVVANLAYRQRQSRRSAIIHL